MYSHHNTTDERGRPLTDYENRARTQEERILAWFHVFEGLAFTPSEIAAKVFRGDRQPPPLTSVRRAMSNLTAAECLVKTGKKRDGAYGRPEHTWKLPSKQQSLF